MLQKMQKLLLFLQLLITLTIVAPSFSFAGEILINPGKFDHFKIALPEKIVAGEDTTLSLQAVDAFNNVLFNFGDTEREFQIWVTGSAAVKPTSFKSSSFANGALIVNLSDKVAESFTLAIRESGSPIPIVSKDLNVFPNKLTSFVIKSPRIAQAGEPFDLRIIAKDAYGNTVLDPIPGKDINLIFKGDADLKIDMPSIPDIKNGSDSIILVSQKSGAAQIEAKDLISGSVGNSDKIEINSGPVNSFKLFAPKDVIAGEPFEVSIVAVDRFNNVVSNYGSVGSGMSLTSTGRLKPFPSTIPAYEFVNGQAKVDLRYDIAEDIAIIATDNVKGEKGSTETIHAVSPVPERYEVTTPESAMAGQKFKLKVTVYNQLNHVIRNYNLVGPDVLLTTTGSGTLVPNKIPASEFINGNAVVEVQYNKSEAFSITASAAKTSTPSSPVQPQPPVSVKKPATAAEKQQAKQAKAVAPVKQTKKSKKVRAKELKEAKGKEKRAKETKAKVTRQLDINNISLVESKKKSVVTVNIPGIDNSLKYDATTEMIDGKRWVVLKIQPVGSKAEKTYKFTSSFIGDIMVDEDTQNKGVTVKIELIKPSKFHVTKEKNAISVNLRQ